MSINPKPCPMCNFPTGYFKPIQKDLRLLSAMYKNTICGVLNNIQGEKDALPPEFIVQLKNQLKLISRIQNYVGN